MDINTTPLGSKPGLKWPTKNEFHYKLRYVRTCSQQIPKTIIACILTLSTSA